MSSQKPVVASKRSWSLKSSSPLQSDDSAYEDPALTDLRLRSRHAEKAE